MVRGYHSQFKTLSPNVKYFLAGNAVQGFGLSVYGLLFSLYLKELGFGESIIGSLISTTSLGIAVMAIPAALVIERFHVKPLVMTGMLFSSLFYLIQIMNVDQSSLFTFGLLASMFQALFNISVSPFYLRNSTPEGRVHLFTLNSGLNMGAHLFGYLVGGYLPKIVHWFDPSLERIACFRVAIMLALSVVFCSNIMFMRIKRVPIPKGRRNIFAGLRERDWKIISRLVTPKLCLAMGSGVIVPFMNLYMKERFHLSTNMIGVSYALLQLFIFTGIFMAPLIVRKTSQLKLILITSCMTVPVIISMGLFENVTLVLSCFFMRGMFMNMSSPIASMFEMEHVREKECVFASAIICFFYHLVYATGTRIGGEIIERYSFSPTFYIAGLCYGTGAFLYYKFFFSDDKVQTTETDNSNIPKAA